MDELVLKDIRLKGRHGCFAREREEYCEFLVSVRMRLDLSKAARTDSLEDTIDYPAAVSIAEGVISGESVRLIEKLADTVASRMFARFGALREIDVKVAKCNNDYSSFVGEISVSISRRREDYF